MCCVLDRAISGVAINESRTSNTGQHHFPSLL
jgi:hypothetical protein